MRTHDTSHRATAVCIDSCTEDVCPVCRALQKAKLNPECYSSILRGTAALGTKEVAFVLIEYTVSDHVSVLRLVNLCHRLNLPVAVMVSPQDQPKPKLVEEIGCMWLKDREFLKLIPSLILGGTGLLPPTR